VCLLRVIGGTNKANTQTLILNNDQAMVSVLYVLDCGTSFWGDFRCFFDHYNPLWSLIRKHKSECSPL
jgi:hypothetical protein